ncbi:MAG: DUF4962 domain-containing protein [Chthonomonadetes bacterium]|nr:DUF4962 domain-containing protein [Chthonomonadetes bacterium]
MQTPDRQPMPGEWGYRPENGSTVTVNPPSLTWVHDREALSYDVQWSTRKDLTSPVTVEGHRWCVYTHHKPLEPGRYYWRYRVRRRNGEVSAWSQPREFVVPSRAVVFPQPTLAQIRERIGSARPRLFVCAEDLPALRSWIRGNGRNQFTDLQARAERLLRDGPTPEPTVLGSIRNPQTRQYWWSNRVQTVKACMEAELLAFLFLLTEEPRYAEGARRWVAHLASWDPDGPTNFAINCEAAKPMLHRLPRAYDWAYSALSEAEREQVRRVMVRRATDAWRSWEVQEGNGHLSRPYDSHGNRTWHKLAECAIAFLGEIPEAETWLDYAVHKFFAAYPVWSDDDGGWHEGLSYWAGYMSKIVWWTEVAQKALGIDSFKKPFFSRAGDYALYTAPPGSPDMGFGDLSHGRPSAGWSFAAYFAHKMRNPYWKWWCQQWNIKLQSEEPVLNLLWNTLPEVAPKPPTDLPPSRVFHGTGVAILNSTLLDARDNVQVRFKSSPFGRQSHGHDPHNSFTLNAYGEALLTNCVYRDIHGSPFHTQWCWSTVAQNAMLVNGEGQKPHSPDPFGRIIAEDLQDGADYIAGEATDAYGGKLRRYVRHVLFVKPDLVLLVDEAVATQPSQFAWMLHALVPFEIEERAQRLRVERERAGVYIHYIAPSALRMRQWDGYTPPPDAEYLRSVGSRGFPNQWHVEARTTRRHEQTFTLTVIRPYLRSRRPAPEIEVEENDTAILIRMNAPDGTPLQIAVRRPGVREASVAGWRFTHFALAMRGGRRWLLGKP